MDEPERIERRLAAVERALVDGERAVADLPDAANVADSVDRLDSRLDDLERRVAGVEGEVRSVAGFVGNVESVNEDVERRADVAVAAVDRLERRLDDLEAAAGTETGADAGSSGDVRRPLPRADPGSNRDLGSTDARFDAGRAGFDDGAPGDTGDATEGGPGGVRATVRNAVSRLRARLS